ncbi:hypothetical protein PQQ51_11660 [Paraburkholderia xenovorans]|uniref:hypothetical protein n=1 Tax=Paraburkholderia xenovorans TaxID=36873 RepID=UPI0038BC6D8D
MSFDTESEHTIRFQPRGRVTKSTRTFEITLTSRLTGYYINIVELKDGGGRVPVALNDPPRYTLHPAAFHSMRKHYRGELVGEIFAELRHEAVRPIRLSAEPGNLPESDAYIEANHDERIWPDGFEGAVVDDLSDWLPHLQLKPEA